MEQNETLDKLAEQCYTKTGSPHTDYFDYVKFGELLIEAIYNEVKEELIPDHVIDAVPDMLPREYLKGNNGGVVDALCIIQNFGKVIEE